MGWIGLGPTDAQSKTTREGVREAMDEQAVAAKPQKRPRRFFRWIVGLAILVLLAIASAPTVLSTLPVRRLLVQTINKRLSPGRVELGGVSLSWTREITLRDVALFDPQGKQVVTAEAIRTDRGILGLLSSRPDYGTIRVEGATVDAERRADGSIDVLDALGGLLGGDDSTQVDRVQAGAPVPAPGPGPAVAVIVQGGHARIASPELAEPIEAGAFEASATIVPGKPLDVVVTLNNEGRSLELRAGYDLDAAAGTSADQTLTLTGKDWPLAVRQAGVRAEGRLDGVLQADRKQGLWSAQIDAILRSFVAEGPVLAGDRLVLERVTAGSDVAQTASGWSIRKLDLKSPIAELTATGGIPATAESPTKLKGHVDLAATSKLLPRAIPLRNGIVIAKGQARIEAALGLRDGVERLDVSADVADLAATENGRPLALRDPASLSAALVRTKENIAVESFALKAAGVDAKATGDLQRGIKLSGAVDLAAIQTQARELIDMGAVNLAGKGRLAADYRPDGATFKARFAAEIDGLKIEGLTTDPIARAHIRLEGTSDGPRSEHGLPIGWRTARLGIDAGESKLNLHAKATNDVATLVLDGSTPITAPAPAVASAKVTMRRVGPMFELDEVHVTATPTDRRAASAALGLVGKGRFDTAAGTLVLIPVGPQPAQGLAIGPQGFLLGGLGKPDAPMTVDAVLAGELSALDRALVYWLQTPALGLGGGWSGRATLARQADGRFDFKGWVHSPNLTAGAPRGPVTLNLNGVYASAVDRLILTSFDLNTACARLLGGGTISEVGSRRLADVGGALEPRWEAIDPIVASAVEPNAQVRATVKPFRLRGSLAGGSTSQILKGMQGDLAVDVASAQAFGMKLGPAPVVLRLAGGKAVFDPISTTLNGGQVAIIADLGVDDPNALWLRLAKGTKIEGAAINETVSNDVLSYIAPVLSKASNVTGKVSLTVDGALIPLAGDGSLRVDGQLTFQDVVCQSGPFAAEVFSLTGKTAPKISLQQPLQLQIADGRVKQSGLTIPLANNLNAKLEGSVGFDKTLAMRALLPVTPQMLGGNASAAQIVGDTYIPVPIGGTISRPIIDRASLRVALRDAARSMVKRGVKTEAGRLLDQVIPPAAANGANGTRNSLGRDALKALEQVGRELAQPKQR
jgi:translocation and assembly module TamB